MNFVKVFSCAALLSAVLAVTAPARAGCNCNVPPAPAPMSMGAAWNGAESFPGIYGPAAGGGPYTDPSLPYGGTVATNGPHWAPGGYEPRIGSPAYYHDPSGGQYVVTGNPYDDHFGPGFQRSSIHGHYRFPYYNYRAPWYFPGRAVYNRNTNFAW